VPRMTVPLRLTCDCGRAIETEAGETVTCECGRRYDTSRIPQEDFRRVQVSRTRMRLWSRIGVLAVGLCAVLAWWGLGWTGAALALPTACVAWWKAVLPQIRRRQEAELADLPSWQLGAEPE
jgi:hypothetical protein